MFLSLHLTDIVRYVPYTCSTLDGGGGGEGTMIIEEVSAISLKNQRRAEQTMNSVRKHLDSDSYNALRFQ